MLLLVKKLCSSWYKLFVWVSALVKIRCLNILITSVTVGMEGMPLLNADVDKNHRAALLRDRKLEPLITRTQKTDWMIHPAWVQRYVFILCTSSS